MGGAILAELILRERIAVDEQKKKTFAEVIDPAPLGGPIIDECLERVRDAKRRATLETWVSRFAGVKNLKHRVAERLCDRGILRSDEDRVLLLFKRRTYPEKNSAPERRLVEGMREAIFTGTTSISPRTVILISLADSSGLLKVVFDKRRLKERKKRIEQIVNGEITGKATRKAIEAMQAAVMVACVMPALMTTTIHH